ncbi:Uncharacterized conserved protein [Rhizobiales bacterium GAS113]|nr:Uncharacterized conserved protein [Rhizobiales bacterium GAS113]
MLVRGIHYEAWHPAEKPEKIRSREEFLTQIDTHFAKAQPIDPECAARAVFEVLENHVTAGEIRHVIQELPREIHALWPEAQARPAGSLIMDLLVGLPRHCLSERRSSGGSGDLEAPMGTVELNVTGPDLAGGWNRIAAPRVLPSKEEYRHGNAYGAGCESASRKGAGRGAIEVQNRVEQAGPRSVRES